MYPSRIPDLGSKTATKERGEKKFVVITFYVATNFTKLQIILVLKKKIWANFQRIIELFTQKIVTKLSKIWIWDPGSGIGFSGGQKAPDPGSGSATLTKIMFNFVNLWLYKKFFSPLSFVAVLGSEIRYPGSGMGKNQDPGSGINIHIFG